MKRKRHDSYIEPDRDAIRRAAYAHDGDRARQASREAYGAPRAQKLANGLLTRGESREVITGEMDHPVSIESFTVPEAAEALGRSVATLRRWIEADKVPEPYLHDLARGYAIYSVGELQVMARVIGQHEREFNYFVSEHNSIVETLHQAVSAYRSEYI